MLTALALVYLLPVIAFALSALATALHTTDELIADGGPIWRYLGFPVRDWAGFLGLITFAAAQIALAAHGYLGGARWALGLLLAVRLGDCVLSHWLPWIRGRRPNPGIATTPLYAAEVVAIALILSGTV